MFFKPREEDKLFWVLEIVVLAVASFCAYWGGLNLAYYLAVYFGIPYDYSLTVISFGLSRLSVTSISTASEDVSAITDTEISLLFIFSLAS